MSSTSAISDQSPPSLKYIPDPYIWPQARGSHHSLAPLSLLRTDGEGEDAIDEHLKAHLKNHLDDHELRWFQRNIDAPSRPPSRGTPPGLEYQAAAEEGSRGDESGNVGLQDLAGEVKEESNVGAILDSVDELLLRIKELCEIQLNAVRTLRTVHEM